MDFELWRVYKDLAKSFAEMMRNSFKNFIKNIFIILILNTLFLLSGHKIDFFAPQGGNKIHFLTR